MLSVVSMNLLVRPMIYVMAKAESTKSAGGCGASLYGRSAYHYLKPTFQVPSSNRALFSAHFNQLACMQSIWSITIDVLYGYQDVNRPAPPRLEFLFESPLEYKNLTTAFYPPFL